MFQCQETKRSPLPDLQTHHEMDRGGRQRCVDGQLGHFIFLSGRRDTELLSDRLQYSKRSSRGFLAIINVAFKRKNKLKKCTLCPRRACARQFPLAVSLDFVWATTSHSGSQERFLRCAITCLVMFLVKSVMLTFTVSTAVSTNTSSTSLSFSSDPPNSHDHACGRDGGHAWWRPVQRRLASEHDRK